MLCWHLSGGTTELLYVKPSGVSIACEILGGTTDVSAGQLIDRAGNLLGMKFPSGAELDALACAETGGNEYTPKIEGYYFSLSGAEHKMKAMVSAGSPVSEIAYFTLWAVTSAVIKITAAARKQYGDLPVLYSGGVASSKFMRRAVTDGLYAAAGYSADNAMGTAILAHRAVANG
jgi:N6-L-threonylcarbamoyladenine synthase